MNFGRFRGPNGPAGGASATGGARDRGDDRRDAPPDHLPDQDDRPGRSGRWTRRPWWRPHWPLPVVFPAPRREGKCHLWIWPRSADAGGFEAGRSGSNADLRSWSPSSHRRWKRAGSIRGKGVCGEVWDSTRRVDWTGRAGGNPGTAHEPIRSRMASIPATAARIAPVSERRTG